jgi:energy-coupling factor transporter ATP-binding protein EcfA2
MSTVKLKRLKIDQYRNVKPGTELHFDDGVNLVLGQNGSGKTTLLGLISMVCGWYFAELEDEEFSIEFEFDRGTGPIRFALGNRQTRPDADEQFDSDEHSDADDRSDADEQSNRVTDPASIDDLVANIDLSDPGDYEFRLSFGDPEVQLHGTPSALTIIGIGVDTQTTPCSPFKHDFLQHIFAAIPLRDVHDPDNQIFVRSLAIALLRPGTPYRFDEGLGCFYALTAEAAPASAPAGPTATSIGVNLVLDLTKTPARVMFGKNRSPFATSPAVLRQVFSKAGSAWGPFDIVASDEIEFLRMAVAQMGFASATLRLAEAETSGPSDRILVQMAGFHFQFNRHDGRSIPHRHLSYGQKRLLAFYYYLANNDAFIIADELVNGLHHRWIDACMKAIGERQAFLTSQNPLLFEHVEFDSIEQVQARFITCKSELVDGAEQLVWQNMHRDDAERFYRGYEAEIENIGDILITRGLW